MTHARGAWVHQGAAVSFRAVSSTEPEAKPPERSILWLRGADGSERDCPFLYSDFPSSFVIRISSFPCPQAWRERCLDFARHDK
jgi:hypothetical protein